jgi:16S rRNA (cytosine1402-N4)-methyltransferase
MMAGPGSDTAAGGGLARHIPVLLDEVLKALAPLDGALIADGTFGAGGYTKALLEAGASVVAIDRDPDAIAAGRQLEEAHAGRLRLIQAPFSELEEVVAGEMLDGFVLDVGVSSMQLDQAARGFSFRLDGPLDMRMSQSGLSAADVVNSFSVGDLARIFGFLGEERHAGRIARAILRRRDERPFERTRDLAETVESVIGRKPGDKIHPATRVFQGLRIFVNDELGELARALFAAERLLKPGGKMAVVTFHSLEDRIVKQFIADRSGSHGGSRHLPEVNLPKPAFAKSRSKPIVPSEAECAANPRARSAKLRAAARTAYPAGKEDMSIFKLPDLPWSELVKGR